MSVRLGVLRATAFVLHANRRDRAKIVITPNACSISPGIFNGIVGRVNRKPNESGVAHDKTLDVDDETLDAASHPQRWVPNAAKLPGLQLDPRLGGASAQRVHNTAV